MTQPTKNEEGIEKAVTNDGATSNPSKRRSRKELERTSSLDSSLHLMDVPLSSCHTIKDDDDTASRCSATSQNTTTTTKIKNKKKKTKTKSGKNNKENDEEDEDDDDDDQSIRSHTKKTKTKSEKSNKENGEVDDDQSIRSRTKKSSSKKSSKTKSSKGTKEKEKSKTSSSKSTKEKEKKEKTGSKHKKSSSSGGGVETLSPQRKKKTIRRSSSTTEQLSSPLKRSTHVVRSASMCEGSVRPSMSMSEGNIRTTHLNNLSGSFTNLNFGASMSERTMSTLGDSMFSLLSIGDDFAEEEDDDDYNNISNNNSQPSFHGSMNNSTSIYPWYRPTNENKVAVLVQANFRRFISMKDYQIIKLTKQLNTICRQHDSELVQIEEEKQKRKQEILRHYKLYEQEIYVDETDAKQIMEGLTIENKYWEAELDRLNTKCAECKVELRNINTMNLYISEREKMQRNTKIKVETKIEKILGYIDLVHESLRTTLLAYKNEITIKDIYSNCLLECISLLQGNVGISIANPLLQDIKQKAKVVQQEVTTNTKPYHNFAGVCVENEVHWAIIRIQTLVRKYLYEQKKKWKEKEKQQSRKKKKRSSRKGLLKLFSSLSNTSSKTDTDTDDNYNHSGQLLPQDDDESITSSSFTLGNDKEYDNDESVILLSSSSYISPSSPIKQRQKSLDGACGSSLLFSSAAASSSSSSLQSLKSLKDDEPSPKI